MPPCTGAGSCVNPCGWHIVCGRLHVDDGIRRIVAVGAGFLRLAAFFRWRIPVGLPRQRSQGRGYEPEDHGEKIIPFSAAFVNSCGASPFVLLNFSYAFYGGISQCARGISELWNPPGCGHVMLNPASFAGRALVLGGTRFLLQGRTHCSRGKFCSPKRGEHSTPYPRPRSEKNRLSFGGAHHRDSNFPWGSPVVGALGGAQREKNRRACGGAYGTLWGGLGRNKNRPQGRPGRPHRRYFPRRSPGIAARDSPCVLPPTANLSLRIFGVIYPILSSGFSSELAEERG